MVSDCHCPQGDPDAHRRLRLAVHTPAARLVTVGITLVQPYQRQGFATEALSCLFDYLFTQRHLHRVVADTDPQNTPAWTLLEHLGMRREGHLLQSLWFKGRWADEYLYAMLREEWLTQRRRSRQAASAAEKGGNIYAK